MNKKYFTLIIYSTSLLLVIVLLAFTFTNNMFINTSNTQFAKPTIIIDPGHGGEDGGASTSNNVLEKDINLSISNKLKSFFTSNGFSVIMTRDTDTALYDPNVSNQKKRSDLSNRVNIFNSSNNNIVISIHQNKFEQPQYSGTQIFYSTHNDKSEALAECVKNSVKNLLQPNNERQCKKAGSEIYILDNTTVPAVLVECGFLSNEDEAKRIQNDKYQNDIAYCIYLGFLEYYYRNY